MENFVKKTFTIMGVISVVAGLLCGFILLLSGYNYDRNGFILFLISIASGFVSGATCFFIVVHIENQERIIGLLNKSVNTTTKRDYDELKASVIQAHRDWDCPKCQQRNPSNKPFCKGCGEPR